MTTLAVKLQNKTRMDKQVIRTSIPLILLILITVFFQAVSGRQLLSPRNMTSLSNSMFTIILGATGVSFLMGQGNLDFSLGSVMGLSAALAGYSASLHPILSIIVGIMTGIACGLVNGIIHTKFHVSSIITTLSTAFIFRGIQCTLITTGAVSIPSSMMSWENAGLKVAVMVMVVGIGALLYTKTRLGKYSIAIGSREEAAYQSGIRVVNMKLAAFMIAGGMAGFAGFFNLIRAASASANTGKGFEFDVLLALLLGGMPISGGSGARFRSVVIGSMIMTILSNGMVLWGLDSVLQQLIRGIIFLVSVSMSFDRRNVSTIV